MTETTNTLPTLLGEKRLGQSLLDTGSIENSHLISYSTPSPNIIRDNALT